MADAKTGGRTATAWARGHPAIRVTHHKTFELTRDTAVTQRATCVVGVDARFDPVAWGMLRGHVAIELRIGDQVLRGTGAVNPTHRLTDRMVIRRGQFRDGDTWAVDATLTAADVPPAAARLLADPATEVVFTVTEVRKPPPLVLVSPADTGPPPGRVGLLWEAADERVELDRGPARFHGHTVAATLSDPRRPLSAAGSGWLGEARRHGARVFVFDPNRAGHEAAEMSVLLAAGCPPVPVVQLGVLDRRAARSPSVRRVLRAAVAPTVAIAPAVVIAELLAEASGGSTVAVPDTMIDLGAAVQWLPAEAAIAELAARGTEETTVVVTADTAGNLVRLDAVTEALANAGMPRRAIAEALRPLGVSRRQLYAAASASGDTPENPKR